MKRIAFALGLAALFASTSASAIKVPTGNTDYDLNVSVLIQARYEGTFEGSTEKWGGGGPDGDSAGPRRA